MPLYLRRLLPVVLAGTLVLGQLSTATAQTAETTADEDRDFTDVVRQLREEEIGFGAIAHLSNLAGQLDMEDALELLETIPMVDGSFDFDFGEMKQRLDPEQRAAWKEQAKTSRDLVKAAKAELKAEDLEDADDAHDSEGDESAEDEASEPAEDDKAQLIADAFGVPVDDVIALRADGIGWGAMFRLASLAYASSVTIDELLESNDSTGLALGKLRKMLDADQLEALEKGPRNFGHLVSGKADKPGKPEKSNRGKNKDSAED